MSEAESAGRYRNIRVETRAALTWIVLDRPGQANALSLELLDEFTDALRLLAREGAPILGIRGEGRGFSGGYDVSAVNAATAAADPVADRERLQGYIDTYLRIWDHPKPIIAAVHGYCIAGATQMCVFADLTLVADDARIGEPTLPMGGGFVAPLWAPLVGPKRAKELAFQPAHAIDGPTAVEWGWANHSLPESELFGEVERLAGRMAKIPSDVLRIKKLSINRAMEAMGVRHATAAVAEMDALLHLAPSVHALREWIGEVGFKEARRSFTADAEA